MTELEGRTMCLQLAHDYVKGKGIGKIEVVFGVYINLLTDNGRLIFDKKPELSEEEERIFINNLKEHSIPFEFPKDVKAEGDECEVTIKNAIRG